MNITIKELQRLSWDELIKLEGQVYKAFTTSCDADCDTLTRSMYQLGNKISKEITRRCKAGTKLAV